MLDVKHEKFDLVESIDVSWCFDYSSYPRNAHFVVTRNYEKNTLKITIDRNPNRSNLSYFILKTLIEFYTTNLGNPSNKNVDIIVLKDGNENTTAKLLEEYGFKLISNLTSPLETDSPTYWQLYKKI